MPLVSQEYQKLVLDDIHSYAGLCHPVKANLLERLFCRSLPIGKIHPNPDDEFSNPDIGPSGEIISRYVNDWRQQAKHNAKPEIEKICVEKMSFGGYMLLDGHHRWMAAHRLGINQLPVQIMNVSPLKDILDGISASQHKMCASFDLDEVLMINFDSPAADPAIPLVFRRMLKKSIRRSAPILIKELQRIGFDVWVYTDRFVDTYQIQKFFSLYGVKVNGIIGGLKNKSSRSAIRSRFVDQYEVSLHIDNSGIVCVDTRTKQFDSIDITCDASVWGGEIFTAVKQLPIVKAHL